jgi:hypothetical protein
VPIAKPVVKKARERSTALVIVSATHRRRQFLAGTAGKGLPTYGDTLITLDRRFVANLLFTIPIR